VDVNESLGMIDKSPTGALIDAVLADQPTAGGLEQLSERLPKRVTMRSGIGAVAATTVGKIVLCTAVAAASVGGVYATTDRIDVSDVDENTTPPDAPEIETPARATDGGSEDVAVQDDHGQEVTGFAAGTELEGCERGQAISEVASAGADDHRQSVDPCSRSDERGSGAAEAGSENRNDHDVDGAEVSEAASAAAPGKPAAPGGTQDRGRSAGAGKP
jgi:hypothetical protein